MAGIKSFFVRKKKEVKEDEKITPKQFRLWIYGFWLLPGVFIFSFYFFILKDLPNPQKLNFKEVTASTKIYDRTGQTVLYDIHGKKNQH